MSTEIDDIMKNVNDLMGVPVQTTVLGVTRGRRQIVIASLKRDTQILILHRPVTDEYPEAAAVCAVDETCSFGTELENSFLIGYLTVELAQELFAEFGDGYILNGYVSDITGGTKDDSIYGCNISFRKKNVRQDMDERAEINRALGGC